MELKIKGMGKDKETVAKAAEKLFKDNLEEVENNNSEINNINLGGDMGDTNYNIFDFNPLNSINEVEVIKEYENFLEEIINNFKASFKNVTFGVKSYTSQELMTDIAVVTIFGTSSDKTYQILLPIGETLTSEIPDALQLRDIIDNIAGGNLLEAATKHQKELERFTRVPTDFISLTTVNSIASDLANKTGKPVKTLGAVYIPRSEDIVTTDENKIEQFIKALVLRLMFNIDFTAARESKKLSDLDLKALNFTTSVEKHTLKLEGKIPQDEMYELVTAEPYRGTVRIDVKYTKKDKSSPSIKTNNIGSLGVYFDFIVEKEQVAPVNGFIIPGQQLPVVEKIKPIIVVDINDLVPYTPRTTTLVMLTLKALTDKTSAYYFKNVFKSSLDIGSLNVMLQEPSDPSNPNSPLVQGRALTMSDPDYEKFVEEKVSDAPLLAIEVRNADISNPYMKDFIKLATPEFSKYEDRILTYIANSLGMSLDEFKGGTNLPLMLRLNNQVLPPIVLPYGIYSDMNGNVNDIRKLDILQLAKITQDLFRLAKFMHSGFMESLILRPEIAGVPAYLYRLYEQANIAASFNVTEMRVTGKLTRVFINPEVVNRVFAVYDNLVTQAASTRQGRPLQLEYNRTFVTTQGTFDPNMFILQLGGLGIQTPMYQQSASAGINVMPGFIY